MMKSTVGPFVFTASEQPTLGPESLVSIGLVSVRILGKPSYFAPCAKW